MTRLVFGSRLLLNESFYDEPSRSSIHRRLAAGSAQDGQGHQERAAITGDDALYTYTDAGLVKSVEYRGSVPLIPYAYDVRMRLTKIGDALTDTYPFSANYTYSDAGPITDWRQKQKGVNPFCQVFPYDAGARLAGADFQVASTTAGACAQTTNWDLSGVSYDANGNITALTRKSSTGTNLDVLS